MSINTEIERIENNISDAYNTMEEAGAEMPTERNSANLTATVSNTIENIANQSYRKLTEALYSEVLTYGTYNNENVEDGEIFTTYKGTFEEFHNIAGNYTLKNISSYANDFILNQNTDKTPEKIKLWEGTLTEFNSQTQPIYAWEGNTPENNTIVQSFNDAYYLDRGIIAFIVEENRYLMVGDMAWDGKIYEFNKSLILTNTYTCEYAVPYITAFFKSGEYYVASGYSNIAYSKDLKNWTAATSTELPTARTVSNIGNTWVIADENNTGNMYYSTDMGTTWTTVEGATGESSYVSEFDKVNEHLFTYSANAKNTFVSGDGITWSDTGYVRLRPSCYVNNTYYAITMSRQVLTSTDGITWTDTGNVLPSGYTGACLKYIDDKFYISKTGSIAYSTDLSNWTTLTVTGTYQQKIWAETIPNYLSLRFNVNTTDESNYKLIWYLFDTKDKIFTLKATPSIGDTVYSINKESLGKTITTINENEITLSDESVYTRNSSADWESIITADEKYPEYISIIKDIGVRQYGKFIQNDIVRLTDSQTTTLLNGGSFNGFKANTGTTFLKDDGKVYIYFDSQKIVKIPLEKAYTNSWKWIEKGNDVFLGVRNYRETQSSKTLTDIYMSEDGINWTKTYSFGSTHGDCTGLLFDGTQFVILFVGWNSDGGVYISTNGKTWTLKSTLTDQKSSYIGYQHPLSYKNGRYILTGRYAVEWRYSDNLVNWYSYSLPSDFGGYYYLNNYSNGSVFLCCICDSSSIAAYSTNGTSWTQYTLPFKCSGFTECNGNFFAKANNGNNKVWISSDGINWTETNTAFYIYYAHSIAYYDNKYHAFQSSTNSYICSSDGITWTTEFENINPFNYYNPLSDIYKAGDFVFGKNTEYFNTSSSRKLINWNSQKIYSPGTGINIALDGTISATGVQSITTGSSNGTISVDGTNISVYGLGSAAYTASTNYATSSQGSKADTALQNNGTGTNALAIGNNSTAAGNYGTALGYYASAGGSYGVALGRGASAAITDGIAIGHYASATVTGSIQLGQGTNGTAYSFMVGLNGNNYLLLSSDGKIPTARLNEQTILVEDYTETE